jgi:hypothetical protein
MGFSLIVSEKTVLYLFSILIFISPNCCCSSLTAQIVSLVGSSGGGIAGLFEVLPPEDCLLDVRQHNGDNGVNKISLLDDLQGSCACRVNLGPVRCAQSDVGLSDLTPLLGGCAEADEGPRYSRVSQDLDPEDRLSHRLEVYMLAVIW